MTKTTIERRRTVDRLIARVLRRAAGGAPGKLTGYAAVFDRLSEDFGGHRDRIVRGAFRDVLGDDVRCLVNHNSGQLLGRTRSGTLKLSEDDRGLKFTVDLPDTQAARTVVASIERGDLDGCSFAFMVGEDRWRRASPHTARACRRLRSSRRGRTPGTGS